MTDDAVIGSASTSCRWKGRVFWDPTLPSQAPEARRAIFTQQDRDAGETPHLRSASIGLAISASPATISRARSIADQAISRVETSTFPNSRRWPSGCRRPCRNRSGFRSFTATTASTHDLSATEPRCRRTGLGTVDARRSDGGLHHLLMQWTIARSRRGRPQGAQHPEHGRGRANLLQRHRQRRPGPELYLPITCSGLAALPRVSRVVFAMAPRRTSRRWNRKRTVRCRKPPGNTRRRPARSETRARSRVRSRSFRCCFRSIREF